MSIDNAHVGIKVPDCVMLVDRCMLDTLYIREASTRSRIGGGGLNLAFNK